ncbi:LysM peptidoglycan-binding domain-containing protein [Lacrimispora saccharolytica]|uniref:Peptidoglycan-binding lysin domain protein n=1 Tax=Lacrimispora saccharolytica (strain ATCC 35040 / DSM 2544 / NRCC 2533 / WM1) TaxID=610130 RepID=D9R2N4_LACSW|nr:LysM peptidoglycan-binding domain-containing protein [Lacrimispora saccharolytica]ADL06658.1 Peptidoglycan-binding lysin domain protein [[Clostridium] saccharolyticum WM1]QRV19272.1 LysM peptidoglycan-binding domain-containing protein [Lacrimispora saccharolytica]
MNIHVVQPGETINSISEYYNIPAGRLILENGITNPDNLAIGQTIVIVQPDILYTVRAGDTLESIAEQYGVSPMDLLRNNPYLSDREILYVGETIVITYQTNKTRTIATSGYTFPYIDKSVLIKTLPFLSYLTIFNYRATGEGEIISSADETELIELAKTYGVAPMMFVSTISVEGIVSREVINDILNNPSVQDHLIDNTLQTLKAKGYYGINIYVENVTFDNINSFVEYIKKASARFHSEGYRIVITITPAMNTETPNVNFERIDYSGLCEFVDGIIFASYDWARTYGYPISIFPVNYLIELLDYAVRIIPSEKIFLGITTLGYDWTLPYIPGVTGATVITNQSAVHIAADNGIPIQFNDEAQSPFYYYTDSDGILHVVWFKDARSFDARARLAAEYNLQGLSLWTIMKFDTQMWFIINTQYYIEKH